MHLNKPYFIVLQQTFGLMLLLQMKSMAEQPSVQREENFSYSHKARWKN